MDLLAILLVGCHSLPLLHRDFSQQRSCLSQMVHLLHNILQVLRVNNILTNGGVLHTFTYDVSIIVSASSKHPGEHF